MEVDVILHMLRNPWGHEVEELRIARLEGADLIERLTAERDALLARHRSALAALAAGRTVQPDGSPNAGGHLIKDNHVVTGGYCVSHKRPYAECVTDGAPP